AEVLKPGESWLFQKTGTALDLAATTASYVVNGCQTGQGIARPTYENYGFVTVTGYDLEDNDPSHYCNPEKPGIEIKKYTNGADADSPDGADVPRIAPDSTIKWTYVVSNTGNVPFHKDLVQVSDDRGLVPERTGFLAGDEDDLLE